MGAVCKERGNEVMKKLFALTICFVFVGVAGGQDEPVNLVESLQKSTWEIGPEIYYFKYEEPGVMEEEGMFYGVAVAYTSRDWVPASPEESAPDDKWMSRFEGRFAYGQVDYSSPISGTIDNIDDYIFEVRGLLGRDFPKAKSMNTIYMGIGYRYLNDDSSGMTSSTGALGYERESNYLYIPIGLKTIGNLKNGWSFGATAEFDFFLLGQQNSHLSDIGFVDIENEQDSGYGLRGSVRFQKHGKKTDFIIEPFIRYWNIDRSDVVLGVYEPENETIEYGISLIWRF